MIRPLCRFPSPIGELHFSIEHRIRAGSGGSRFRPLSGSYISQSKADLPMDFLAAVSVPYRGATFLNREKIHNRTARKRFRPLSGSYISQSEFPVPEHQENFRFRPLSGSYISQSFRNRCIFINVSVPYRGATFLNKMVLVDHKANLVFPSPIGELHFSIGSPPHVVDLKSAQVSVPYRGATFLNTIPATPCPVWDE